LLDLRAPIERVTGYDVPFPYWRLEDMYLPSAERVASAVRRTLEY
jgi:pyruvate/2-oxoglutarate/acetoin dehydrogenase E1 component